MGICGSIDICTERAIAGWVWDSGDARRRLPVAILVDGVPVAEALASQHREDLAGQGIGDASYGFEHAFRPPINPISQGIAVAFPGTGLDPIEVEGWRCPMPVPGLSPAELARRAGGMFHSIDLGGGSWTNGVVKSPERIAFEIASWRFPAELRGKTVLDIGCADGALSVAAFRRGAAQVVSIDERTTGAMRFFLDNKVFPFDFRQIDLFSPEFLALPVFDVVLFAGVLYHVQHPLEALKRVRSKTRELAILETHVNESLGTSLPYMVYYEKNELAADDPTNWWGPNTPCLEAMLRTAGFLANRVFDEGGPANARVCYHLTPDPQALYSEVLASATGADALLAEARQRIARLQGRIRDLEGQLARARPGREVQRG